METHAIIDDYTHTIELFKSYYVVWKLGFLTNKGIFKGCLNRTMQYGNKLGA